MLIAWGANTEILSKTGETPLSLEPKRSSLPTDSCDSGINVTISSDTNNEGFTPNYLQYPELNHKVSKKVLTKNQRMRFLISKKQFMIRKFPVQIKRIFVF